MAKPQTIEQKLDHALRAMTQMRREIRELKEIVTGEAAPPDRLIGVREACNILGKKKSSVYAMIASGILPAHRKVNGRFQLSFNQIQKFIKTI
ncbi:MAG: helix-turn-helix domain-containing protein [Bacteroides sp.]|nr:helix-turn-helix domain-containing protein [Bacteroides sp.]